MNRVESIRGIELEALQGRFARRVTAHLDAGTDSLPHDLGERLRVARDRAVLRARQARLTSMAPAATAPQALVGLGSVAVTQGSSWGIRLASAAPVMMLLLGLVFIQHLHQQAEIHAAADIDAALLADDLPPEAYSDPGFVVYLKQPLP